MSVIELLLFKNSSGTQKYNHLVAVMYSNLHALFERGGRDKN